MLSRYALPSHQCRLPSLCNSRHGAESHLHHTGPHVRYLRTEAVPDVVFQLDNGLFLYPASRQPRRRPRQHLKLYSSQCRSRRRARRTVDRYPRCCRAVLLCRNRSLRKQLTDRDRNMVTYSPALLRSLPAHEGTLKPPSYAVAELAHRQSPMEVGGQPDPRKLDGAYPQ